MLVAPAISPAQWLLAWRVELDRQWHLSRKMMPPILRNIGIDQRQSGVISVLTVYAT
jgi:hypothetical protein